MCQALKFVSFCRKNNDIPFYVKMKVFNAAVMPSILYGWESWMSGIIKTMEKLYYMCVKHLLGVRKSTTNSLCLIELGLASLKALGTCRLHKFFKKMQAEREGMFDDPFAHAVNLIRISNIPTSRLINNLIEIDVDDVGQYIKNLY